MDMDYKILGKRIREQRNKLHLTQEALAEQTEISDSYMGQIERGERQLALDTLVKLANRFGVTIDYLLADSVSVKDDAFTNELLELLTNRTSAEKRLALDVIKIMLSHLDESRS